MYVVPFYIDSEKFNRALLTFSEHEKDLRQKAGIGITTWYAAKKGNVPVMPRTINRLATLLQVEPEYLILCNETGRMVKAVIST